MNLVELKGDPHSWQLEQPTAVTIGVFDGVHRGHQSGISHLVNLASAQQLTPTVLTFSAHPLAHLAPDWAPQLLTTLSDRIELMSRLGVEVVGILPFAQIADMTASDFLADVLVDRMSARLISTGSDFRFGHQRAGDINTLATLGPRLGFSVEQTEMIADTDQLISSSRIRELIGKGEVTAAARLLGRPYHLSGTVTTGERRGTKIGFPTANLSGVEQMVVPAHGIYAGWAFTTHRTEPYPTMINVGVRPTFGADLELVVEAYLVDFSDDLYQQPLTIVWMDRLRDELTFESVDELISAIRSDVELGMERLAALPVDTGWYEFFSPLHNENPDRFE